MNSQPILFNSTATSIVTRPNLSLQGLALPKNQTYKSLSRTNPSIDGLAQSDNHMYKSLGSNIYSFYKDTDLPLVSLTGIGQKDDKLYWPALN